MAIPYSIHLFVCQNERSPGHPRGDCASKGAAAVHARIRELAKLHAPDANVRVNKCGCLDTCEDGVSVAVYPAGVWYGGVKTPDAEAIVFEHLLGGKPVTRLRIDGRADA
jgi:(2Fe-2S) ferredoxin